MKPHLEPPPMYIYLADEVLKNRVFYGTDGDAYITVDLPDGKVTWPLDSTNAIAYMTRKVKDAMKDVLSTTDIEKGTRAAMAEVWDKPKRKVYMRSGEHEGSYYLDLHTQPRQWVRFDDGGWRVQDSLPDALHFAEGQGMLPLPVPDRTGNRGHLKMLFRLDEYQWRVFLPMLVSYLLPNVQQPLAVLAGEQGSGKSTFAITVKRLIDDNVTLLNSAPKDERDLFIKVSSTRLPVFDNLSHLDNKQLDALCMTATGGTFQTRRLYTDRQQVTIQVLNPVILAGIANMVPRGDAADRALLFQLKSNDAYTASRVSAEQLNRTLEELRPKCLGALLNLTCDVLRILKEGVATPHGVRITHYGRIGLAVEKALNWPPGFFLQAYQITREPLEDSVLDEKVIMPALLAYLDVYRVSGTRVHEVKTAELLAALTAEARDVVKHSNYWPKSTSTLGKELRMCAPALRKRYGWNVEDVHKAEYRAWRFTYTEPQAAQQTAERTATARDYVASVLKGEVKGE